jgi:hypothetical protein
MKSPDILVFKTLLNSKEFTVAFKDLKSFDIHGISNDDAQVLSAVSGLEIIFPTTVYSLAVASNALIDLQTSFTGYLSLFYLKELPQPISRTRSHRGLLKNIKNTKPVYTEKEYILKNNESFFASVVDLKTMDNALFMKYCFNSSLNFISMKRMPSEIRLNDLEEVVSNYYEPYGVNYLKLVLQKCAIEQSVIVRFGGDGGATYTSAQYFVPEKLFGYFFDHLNTYVSSTNWLPPKTDSPLSSGLDAN